MVFNKISALVLACGTLVSASALADTRIDVRINPGRNGGWNNGGWNGGGRGGWNNGGWNGGDRGGWNNGGWNGGYRPVSVRCVAQNARGFQFVGVGTSVGFAQQQALNQCYNYGSFRCFVVQCSQGGGRW